MWVDDKPVDDGYVSIYLAIYLSVYLYIYLSIYLSIHLYLILCGYNSMHALIGC